MTSALLWNLSAWQGDEGEEEEGEDGEEEEVEEEEVMRHPSGQLVVTSFTKVSL